MEDDGIVLWYNCTKRKGGKTTGKDQCRAAASARVDSTMKGEAVNSVKEDIVKCNCHNRLLIGLWTCGDSVG